MAFLYPALIALVLTARLAFVSALPGVTTVSGRDISRAALLTRAAHLHALPDLSRHVFEVAPGLILRGPNCTVDLARETSIVHRIESPDAKVIFVDGKPRQQPVDTIIVREGAGYTVVTNVAGDIVHFLSAPHLNLVAVDSTGHPGMFVNVHTGARALKKRVATGDLRAPMRTTVHALNSLSAKAALAGVKCSPGDPVRVLELAMTSDSETCRVYGGKESTTAKLTYLAAKASRKFSDASCLRIRVVFLEVNCNARSDPYRGIRRREDGDLLDGMAAIWNKRLRYRSVKRDLVAFIAPKIRDDDAEGTAYRSHCEREAGFSWTAAVPGDDAGVFTTLAHEMGHNLGLDHSETGIMGDDSSASARFSHVSAVALQANLRTWNARCIALVGEGSVRAGKMCTAGIKATDCIRRFVLMGKIPIAKFNGQRRDLSVFVRLVRGRFAIKLSAPKTVDRNPASGRDMHYEINGALIIPEYDTSGGVVRTSGDTAPEIVIRVRESALRLPVGESSCCGQGFDVHVEATMVAFYGNGEEVWDSTMVVSQIVSIEMPCKTCPSGRPASPMTRSSPCPVCK